MPNNIAEFYTDELLDWNDSILFYNKEMDDFEKRLGEVVRRNSIVGIANKVEAQQNLLNLISEKFYRTQIEIQQQQASLKTDSTLLDDTQINEATEKKQNDLRRKMQAVEREYIDIKFGCYNFLSGTLKK